MLRELLKESGLTPRQVEIVCEVIKGDSSREIAERMNLSEKTVKFHLTNIYKKLQVTNRTKLTIFCIPFKSEELI